MSSGRTHGGKGSKTRPTDTKKYADNYDAIFGKGKEKKTLEEILDQIMRIKMTAKTKKTKYKPKPKGKPNGN
tara:strand:- start:2255 stop:2470 length:216 start_codon:yes stop_codon:yes gene_type:complete